MIKLFKNKKDRYYYTAIEQCNICKCDIEDIIIIKFNWSKKRSWQDYYCLKCGFEDNKVNTELQEIKLATVILEAPEDTIPIFIRPPELTSNCKCINVFYAANSQNIKSDDSECKVKYKGKYLGQPNYTLDPNMQIGDPSYYDEVKHLDINKNLISQAKINKGNKLEINEFKNLLRDIKNSDPVIEDKNHKLLEKKEGV